MRNHRLFLVFIPLALVLTGMRLDWSWLVPMEFPVRIVRVLDGDTLDVFPGGRVRLMGVDAPEKGQPARLGHVDAGAFATACLVRALQGRSWWLRWVKKDMYGRVLGDLRSGEVSLNVELLRAGCVAVYPFLRDFSREEAGKLKRIMQESQQARRGLWSKGGFMTPYWWRKHQKAKRKPAAAE